MTAHIVMTGYDQTVFCPAGSSDTRQRLQTYAALLSKDAAAHITYICLRTPAHLQAFVESNVTFIPISGGILQMPFRLMLQLRKLRNISLICTQTPYEDGLAGMIFASLHDIPFAVQVHNDPTHTPGGRLRFLRQIMSRLCFAQAKLIRVVNPIVGRELEEKYNRRVKVIPVAPAVTPTPRDTLPQIPEILVVSRLSPEKNVALALHVMARVQLKVPEAHMTIAGEGADRAKLERQAKEAGIAVTFLGGLPPSELAKLYSCATLLLLTSREEGLGRVLIEAMFAGLPIVATRTKGASCIIHHGETGYLQDVDDVIDLSESVVELCLDHARNTAMGRRGQQQSQQYLPDVINQTLIAALLEASQSKENL
ncbi:MAG: glycosyltransferase family 4 protein [Pseudomonadota bacterium]